MKESIQKLKSLPKERNRAFKISKVDLWATETIKTEFKKIYETIRLNILNDSVEKMVLTWVPQ